MEFAVINDDSSLLKVDFAFPDQTPTMIITSFDSDFSFYQNNNIIPSYMKRMVDNKGLMSDNDNGQLVVDDVAVELMVRGYVRDWGVAEDLLNYVLYSSHG
ncbi:hypothetical protein KIW84_062313 [Lathyrus oleraceus]|uniref:Uncharacterized protein n=1 Tax=Pisum sativum TaxID=3888 RepID=A0A9D5A5F5_PEA|nr:hypothetical protein KIW84_062313 [Pisum sativum]